MILMTSVNTQSHIPASENSVYFDALDSMSDMPAVDQEYPRSPANYPSYIPPVSTDYDDSPAPHDYLGPYVSQYQRDDDNNISHPNRSYGWLPAVGLPSAEPLTATVPLDNPHSSSRISSSSQLVQTSRSGGPDNQVIDANNTNSLIRAASKRSTFINNEGRPVAGSTFINGVGTTGSNATTEHDGSLHNRSVSAETSLTPKQKSKIVKRETKDNKELSKIIKKEGKVEKQALSLAMKELADMQRFQDAAVKHEYRAHVVHAKTLVTFKKAEAVYLAAKTEYETALARLNAHEEALAKIREGAREATERVQEKSQEVDGLRTVLSVDERERQAKLAQLNGKSKWGLSRN
ncbi:hypothetical protein BDQ17DRAFT_661051 [Cyathus striatus]|nr:hypothetical protein BDQ17DRAFT_661051 [Cyathus striatus]